MNVLRPKISIKTARFASRASADVLSPARIPVPVDWDFSEATPDLLRQVMLGMDVALKGGRHRVRLNPTMCVGVDVAPGGVARVSVRTSTDDVTREARLESFSATFEKPLTVTNVLGILKRFSGLFEARPGDPCENAQGTQASDGAGGAEVPPGMLASMLRRLVGGATQRVPEVAGFARRNLDRAGAILSSMVGEPLAVEISRITGVARADRLKPDSEPVLVMSVSGSIVISRTGAKVAFKELEVPAVVMPRPSTRLSGFLAPSAGEEGGPLSDIEPAVLAVDIARMIDSISGRVDADVTMPIVEASWLSADRTDSRVSVWTEQSFLSLGAHFDASITGADVALEMQELTVKSPGSRRTFVCRATLGGTVGIEDGRPRLSNLSGTLGQTNRGALPVFLVRLSGENPFVKTGSALTVQIDEVRSTGSISFDVDAEGNPGFKLPDGAAGITGVFSLPDQQFGQFASATVSGSVTRGRIDCSVKAMDDGFDVSSTLVFPTAMVLTTRVKAIPELNMVPGPVHLDAFATVEGDIGAFVVPGGEGRAMSVEPRGGASITVERWSLDSPGRVISSAGAVALKAVVREGVVSVDGEGDFAVDLRWSSHTAKVQVQTSEGTTRHRLPPWLARGSQCIHISPGGRLQLSSGRRSFVRPEVWNALMNPATQAGALFELLDDDEFLDGTLDSAAELVDIFNETIGARFFETRNRIGTLRRHAREAGISSPGDIFDCGRVARLVSRLMAGDESLVNEALSLVTPVLEGRGLDMTATRMFILKNRPDLADNSELVLALRLAEIATTPAAAFMPPAPASPPPLMDDPEMAHRLRRIPSAGTVYQWCSKRPVSRANLERILELAPLMYIDQLSYILSDVCDSGHDDLCAELRFVISAKKAISRACGSERLIDLTIVPRTSVLAGFLGDLVGPIPGIDPDDGAGVPESVMGPKDVADVLELNLSGAWQGVGHQINNRMVLELLKRRDGDFLIAVMCELSHDVPVNLALNLMSFFRQDQGHMKVPVDTEALFADKTGLKVPRFEDFVAGGTRGRESYFKALHQLAVEVIRRGAGYHAAKMKLRQAAWPARQRAHGHEGPALLAERARESIEHADALARKVGVHPGTFDALRQTYRDAFDRCADLLRVDRFAFQQDWLKAFWRRSEEASRVASSVRCHVNDDDRVRAWLAQWDRTGAGRRLSGVAATSYDDLQALVDAFVDTIWFSETDREAVAADPLVRLLMEEPAGEYDFTVVSGMGVISDGREGRELEGAFRRLSRLRGISVLRAPTGLFRDLEFNARTIIGTVREVEGPWGYIGYSQGCANGLRAEHMLMTGTPWGREIAGRLVCRNLLFSAANGSAHGSSMASVVANLFTQAEILAKPYQSLYSRDFVQMVRRATGSLLDSRQATALIAGAWSLTMERAVDLHRDGLFMDGVPTSTVRASVTRERLPDALQYVYGMHERLMPGMASDSQVATVDEVGYSTRVLGERGEVLRRCDIGSRPLHAHHWGPVHDELLKMMTRKDIECEKYENPVDMYVFPWIDTNIRFGLIRRKS